MGKDAKIIENKTIQLRKIPADVQKIIIDAQKDANDECQCTRSQEWVIYNIIREHNASKQKK